MVGEVSVGIRESSVSSALWRELPSYAVWFAIALGVGALASWGLARRLKRRTFGLELDEIARLLQEREATLHGIREGVIAFDTAGRDQRASTTRRSGCSRLPRRAIGRHARRRAARGPAARRARRRRRRAGRHRVHRRLLPRHQPDAGHPRRTAARRGGHAARPHRDGRAAARARRRAQPHRIAARPAARVLQPDARRRRAARTRAVGRGAELPSTEIRGTAAEFDNTLRAHIAAPQIVGLLLGKAAEASERGIELVISPETWLGESPAKVQALTTIIGNLIDNAFDALATHRRRAGSSSRSSKTTAADHRRGDRQRAGHPARRPSG